MLDPRTQAHIEAIYRAAGEMVGQPENDDPFPRPWTESKRTQFSRLAVAMFSRSADAIGLTKGTEEYDRAWNSYFNDQVLRLRNAYDARPTKLQDPVAYMALLALADRVSKRIRTTIGPVIIPIMGSLPSGRLNAMAFIVPETRDHVVLFESGLLGFANLFTKAIAQLFEVESFAEGKWKARLQQAEGPGVENAADRLVDVLQAKAIRGEPLAAKPYLLDGQHQCVADILRDAFELFVMGHEIGHVCLGHLSEATVIRSAIGDRQVDEVNYGYECEFAADRFGLGVAMNAATEDPRLLFCGSDMFFVGIDLLERSVSILAYGEEKPLSRSRTHPPINRRRDGLRRELMSRLDNATAQEIVAFSERLSAQVEKAWHSRVHVWHEMRRDGIQPALKWA